MDHGDYITDIESIRARDDVLASALASQLDSTLEISSLLGSSTYQKDLQPIRVRTSYDSKLGPDGNTQEPSAANVQPPFTESCSTATIAHPYNPAANSTDVDMLPDIHYKMEGIILGEKIGHGGQAETFKAKYEMDDVFVKRFLDPKHEDCRREVAIFKQVFNRHIVQFYHVEGDLLVMEYLEGGSLSRAISNNAVSDWEHKILIARQVSSGLAYLHSLDIIHCDIKSANILLSKHGDAKICDFRKARTVDQSDEGGGGGTLAWMAPELLQDPPQYTSKSDVYALGMVMWEMAAGCTQPYQGHDPDSITQCIRNGYTEDIPEDTPEEYAACIHECWKQEPEKRPAAEDALPDMHDTPQDNDVDVIRIPEEDQHESLRYLMKGVREGSPNAYYQLGLIYLYGKIVSQDDTKAAKYFLTAGELGNEKAQCDLGHMYNEGRGVKQDYAKAMEWYLKASKAGVVGAKYKIGHMYQCGLGVDKDYTKAMEWYVKVSDAGDLDANFSIGYMYHHGLGVKQDFCKAMDWYLKSGGGGSTDAKLNIGYMYYEGIGMEPDYPKSAEWFLKAKESGSIQALYCLGDMYANGLGVEKDLLMAVECYQKACQEDESTNDVGLDDDDKQAQLRAMEWFQKTSADGFLPAYHLLAEAYFNGFVVSKDGSEAEKWACKAVEEAEKWAKTKAGKEFRETGGTNAFESAVECCKKILRDVDRQKRIEE